MITVGELNLIGSWHIVNFREAKTRYIKPVHQFTDPGDPIAHITANGGFVANGTPDLVGNWWILSASGSGPPGFDVLMTNDHWTASSLNIYYHYLYASIAIDGDYNVTILPLPSSWDEVHRAEKARTQPPA